MDRCSLGSKPSSLPPASPCPISVCQQSGSPGPTHTHWAEVGLSLGSSLRPFPLQMPFGASKTPP